MNDSDKQTWIKLSETGSFAVHSYFPESNNWGFELSPKSNVAFELINGFAFGSLRLVEVYRIMHMVGWTKSTKVLCWNSLIFFSAKSFELGVCWVVGHTSPLEYMDYILYDSEVNKRKFG